MKKLVSIFKNKEVVRRIFFTIAILFVFRIGCNITCPGIDASKLTDELSNGSNNILSMMNLLGGGALQNFSIFALGVSPYITSQIIIQLLNLLKFNSVNANFKFLGQKYSSAFGKKNGRIIEHATIISKSVTGIRESRYEF